MSTSWLKGSSGNEINLVLIGSSFLKIGGSDSVTNISSVFGGGSGAIAHNRSGIVVTETKRFGIKNIIVRKSNWRTGISI